MATNETTPTTQPVQRGFGNLRCLLCGETSVIRLDLDDVSRFICGECEGEFTCEDVKTMLDDWRKVLAWIALAPASADVS
jgi:transposase-like protein